MCMQRERDRDRDRERQRQRQRQREREREGKNVPRFEWRHKLNWKDHSRDAHLPSPHSGRVWRGQQWSGRSTWEGESISGWPGTYPGHTVPRIARLAGLKCHEPGWYPGKLAWRERITPCHCNIGHVIRKWGLQITGQDSVDWKPPGLCKNWYS